jgi:adenine-specific DNA methylase
MFYKETVLQSDVLTVLVDLLRNKRLTIIYCFCCQNKTLQNNYIVYSIYRDKIGSFFTFIIYVWITNRKNLKIFCDL